MKLTVKHIPSFYLFALFAGTLFFIPAIFVNRFTTAPALWMQAGISIGIAGYVLLTKERIPLPPKGFILLIMIWAIYHIWQNRGDVENTITIITLIAGFFLFYAIWSRLKDKKLMFSLFTFLALALSLWGLGQFIGLLPSYNGSFTVTGPFDNPAGISASLVLLLPFSLYYCRRLPKIYRWFAIAVSCLPVCVIILSQARAAILAVAVILILFFARFLQEHKVKLSAIHYTVVSLIGILLVSGLFFMKQDSANGRLLIWQCTGQLISRSPVFGSRGNGFIAHYMNEQADYFTKHPDSRFVMLADNVRHPFNEYLKWMVDYGIVGVFLTIFLIAVPLYYSRKDLSLEIVVIRLSLLSIAICASFSYPLNYPFIRLIVVMLLAFALADTQKKGILVANNLLAKGMITLFSLGLLSATIYQAFYERAWHKIAPKSLRGETRQMLPRYKLLYTHLRHKDLFLYNYAAELNVVGHYEESLQITYECEKLWADYDLQMLMADNCLQLQQYTETENHLKKAAAMCPVKFMPLYQLTEFYLEAGRKEEARVLAPKISFIFLFTTQMKIKLLQVLRFTLILTARHIY